MNTRMGRCDCRSQRARTGRTTVVISVAAATGVVGCAGFTPKKAAPKYSGRIRGSEPRIDGILVVDELPSAAGVAAMRRSRMRQADHVRQRRRGTDDDVGASKLVRERHPVGVNEGMRGARGTIVGSGVGRVRRDFDRPTPGSSSTNPPTSATHAAHATHITPRSSGRRDCGNAGYGCAPVKRRRRPVTEGGVCARLSESLMESLMDLPKAAGGPRLDFAQGTKPMTITRRRRARRA
jgi:hypothetical protein